MNVVRTSSWVDLQWGSLESILFLGMCLGYLIFYLIILKGPKDQFIPPLTGLIAIVAGVLFLLVSHYFNRGYELGPWLLLLCFICGPAGLFAAGLTLMYGLFWVIQGIRSLLGLDQDY